MDEAVDTAYHPVSGFVEDKRERLIDLELTDSTELWLFQWPINQTPEFNGQRVSVKLEGDGHIGSFECSSGKSYEMFTLKSQSPKETVFLSSASEAKIAGKICRHVSLINYPEPGELQKRNMLNLSLSQRSSMATSTMSGQRLATPSRSTKPRNSQGTSGYSSRTKSGVSGLGEPSKASKRKRRDDRSHSAQDSGKTNSAVTSTGSGSTEQSQETKSKKKRKTEN